MLRPSPIRIDWGLFEWTESSVALNTRSWSTSVDDTDGVMHVRLDLNLPHGNRSHFDSGEIVLTFDCQHRPRQSCSPLIDPPPMVRWEIVQNRSGFSSLWISGDFMFSGVARNSPVLIRFSTGSFRMALTIDMTDSYPIRTGSCSTIP